MNRGELRELTSIWLDDVNNGYFTVSQLNIFLNNAQREVQKLLIQAGEDYYTKCVETTTVANQKNYLWPSDFLKAERLAWVTQGSGDTAATQPISFIARGEQDLFDSFNQGEPQAAIINKDTFALVPVPNKVYTIRLDYAYRVSDMGSDGSEPDVPEDYHEMIAIIAARDGFMRDGRNTGAIDTKMIYYKDLMKQNADQRQRQSSRTIRSDGGGFGWM